jgi:transposase-like protein
LLKVCPRCGSERTRKRGRMKSGNQIRECRDCKRAYSAATVLGRNDFKGGERGEQKWETARQLLERGATYSDIARLVALSPTTVLKISKGVDRPLCVCGKPLHGGRKWGGCPRYRPRELRQSAIR